ncbi:ParA family protein [Algirhabdus cladophorae]|uniref:ParA family protein n=1 Tax=Algirhabdus cladophorae TaxID=3377108 RepID=UPI003B848789
MPKPSPFPLPRVVAVVNQKGGVGKTTTTINLAAALGSLGLKVLIVDIDPQGNASTGVGIDDRDFTIYDVLLDEASLKETVKETEFENLWIIPTTTDLSSADIELVANEKRSFLLNDSLRNVEMSEFGFDVVLIDCPPSLNLLTVNALIASDSLIIPLQAEFFALEGLSQLMMTVRDIRSTANKDLRIDGVLLTMFDVRNNLSQQVEADARDNLGDLVFDTKIPRNIRLSEAPSFAMPINQYDPKSKGGLAYDQLAREVSILWRTQ